MLTPDDHALLNDLLDERLPSAEEQALLQRLEREPSLREAYDQLVRLRTLVERSPDAEPPPGFLDQVRERLRSARDDDVDDAPPERSGPTPAAQPPPGTRTGTPSAWGGAASADPASASDGRLRPLPRLSHDPDPGAPSAGPVPADSAPADAAAGHLAAGVPESQHIPVFWRRMMTVAYAAAALLVVGVGLLAVRDRERDASRAAQGDRAREQARARRPGPGDAGGAAGVAEEAREPRRDGLAKEDNSVPPPAAATLEATESDGDALEAKKPEALAPGAPKPEEGRSRDAASEGDGRGRIGFGGPGGAVRPGLRAPSDDPLPAAPLPAPPPPAPSPAPPGAAPSGPAPTSGGRTSAPRPAATAAAPRPSLQPAERSAPGSKPPAPGADPAAPGPLVLVLEADDLASGRALLAAVVSGPGPRTQRPGAAAAAPDFTRVRLRRLEPARDAALLAGLSPADRAGLGAEDARRSGASAPRTVPGGGGAAPLSAPAATAPLPGATANGLLLGLEPLDLSPEELARLEALLGPAEPRGGEAGGSAGKGSGATGSGSAGSGAGDKSARSPDGEGSDAKTAPARRAVRVLITRAR